MPISDKLLDLSVYLTRLVICSEYLVCYLWILLTNNIDYLLCLARSNDNVRLKSATSVGVIVELVIAEASFNCNRVAVCSVRADKAVQITVISGNRSANYAEKSFSPVRAVLVLTAVLIDMLNDLVALKACSCDEQSILEVYLILLIVVLICELYKAEC